MVHLYVLISCRAVGRDYNVMRKRKRERERIKRKQNTILAAARLTNQKSRGLTVHISTNCTILKRDNDDDEARLTPETCKFQRCQ